MRNRSYFYEEHDSQALLQKDFGPLERQSFIKIDVGIFLWNNHPLQSIINEGYHNSGALLIFEMALTYIRNV